MAKSNVENRSVFCYDNLDIMQGINSECIDLIYLDPPFNKNREFTAPMNSRAAGQSFTDIFREKDVKDEWLKTIEQDELELYHYLKAKQMKRGSLARYDYCYLCYMAIRLIEMRRILKPTGSIYLHCDSTMSHSLKEVMDILFGDKNFQNEITWKRTSAHSNVTKIFGRITDTILFYTKSRNYTFNLVYQPYDKDYIDSYYRHEDKRGIFSLEQLTGPGENKNDKAWRGWKPPSKRGWAIPRRVIEKITGKKDNSALSTKQKLDLMYDNNYIVFSKNGVPRFKSYIKDMKGIVCQNIWNDIPPVSSASIQQTGWKTQKPIPLLRRIILCSSKPGDVILDPFCGCATTVVAVEQINKENKDKNPNAKNRQWIGVDNDPEVHSVVVDRLNEELKVNKETKDKKEEQGDLLKKWNEKVIKLNRPPERRDTGKDPRTRKFVYVISNPKQYKGEYKVGIAIDVKRRLGSYQTSDPKRGYKIEFSIETPFYNEIEKEIHEQFDNQHEWVKGKLDDIIKEIKLLHRKYNRRK